jgi:hypothetical protein
MNLMGNSLIPSRSNTTSGRSHQQAAQGTSGARASKRGRPETDPAHQNRVNPGLATGECLPTQDLVQDPTWNNNITTPQTPYPNPSNMHLVGILPQSAQNNQIKQETNIFVR